MSYTLTITKRSVQLLMTHDMRADRLARSLQARAAQAGFYFFTPVRASKWRALYDAGFDAVLLRGGAWVYRHPGIARSMPLNAALVVAPALTPQVIT